MKRDRPSHIRDGLACHCAALPNRETSAAFVFMRQGPTPLSSSKKKEIGKKKIRKRGNRIARELACSSSFRTWHLFFAAHSKTLPPFLWALGARPNILATNKESIRCLVVFCFFSFFFCLSYILHHAFFRKERRATLDWRRHCSPVVMHNRKKTHILYNARGHKHYFFSRFLPVYRPSHLTMCDCRRVSLYTVAAFQVSGVRRGIRQ